MTPEDLRRECEADLERGVNRRLTIRQVAFLERWVVKTIENYVYRKPPLIQSVQVGLDGMKLPRRRIKYTETLRFFHNRKVNDPDPSL